jgi:hypothetical protein
MLTYLLIVNVPLALFVVLCTCLWLTLRFLSWPLVEEKSRLFIELLN